MARLPQGVRKRKDGTLEKRFTINGYRYSIYAGTTKELAEKEHETRERIKAGTYNKNNNIILDDYFEEWKATRTNTTKGNTLLMYSRYYNKHISPAMGNRKIKDIERREVKTFQDRLNNTLSPASINLVLKVLRAVLNDAVKDEIIPRNPASNIKAVRVVTKATDTYHRALTVEEQKAFMQALKPDFYYHYIAVMICTGMRAGEVGALTWQDIDYKNNVIHVTKTLTRGIDGTLIIGDSAKTDAGTRDIPMNDGVKKVLKEYQGKSEFLPFPHNTIFTTPRGNKVDNGRINKAIKNALDSLEKQGVKIEHFTSHALRDTFATRYIEQGGNMHTLQKILGHESITMTMDLYAHVLLDTMQDEMSKIKICI